MFRTHRQVLALLAAVCLLLAAALGFARDLAEHMPAMAAHCHDAADAPAHGHDGHAHGQTPCQQSCAACCLGWAAALPAPVAPLAAADAALWSLSDPVLRLGARAAEIFRPPRVFSSP